MKSFKIMALSTAALVLTAVDADAQTWICDSKALVGFDRESRYEVITFSNRSSYRIEANIDRGRLATSRDKRAYDQLIDSEFQSYKPAGLTVVGQTATFFCRLHERGSNEPTFAVSSISCDSVTQHLADFTFVLDTGLYSMVNGGFEFGGQSWVEVGECRRIN